jgi:hypothetical protein
MRKYVPSIISTDFTRSMEEQLDEIESGKARRTLVIENAIDKLTGTLITLKEKEIEIGRQITEAVIISQNQQQMVLGTCPACSKGILKIIRSRVTKKTFVGCSNYSSGICKATAITERINTNYGEVCFMPMASTQDYLCCKTSVGVLYQYAMSIKKATA